MLSLDPYPSKNILYVKNITWYGEETSNDPLGTSTYHYSFISTWESHKRSFFYLFLRGSSEKPEPFSAVAPCWCAKVHGLTVVAYMCLAWISFFFFCLFEIHQDATEQTWANKGQIQVQKKQTNSSSILSVFWFVKQVVSLLFFKQQQRLDGLLRRPRWAKIDLLPASCQGMCHGTSDGQKIKTPKLCFLMIRIGFPVKLMKHLLNLKYVVFPDPDPDGFSPWTMK